MENRANVIIPDVVAFTITLQLLTRAMYLNPNLVVSLVNYFKKLRNSPGVFTYSSFFHKLKLASIEKSIKLNMRSFDTGNVHAKKGSWMLPLNILEACIDDYYDGFKDNAKTCNPLIRNRPGFREDRYTGAGPTRWSEDKMVICFAMTLPRQWTDLNQTWNMAFISKIPRFLYLLPKLLIPQVADYHDKPMEYIENRVYALYVALMCSGLSYSKWQESGDDFIWSDKRLTTLWGKANLKSADKYKKEIQTRRMERELFV